MRYRLERLRDAPASLVLFTEYIPDSLAAWVADPARRGRGCELVEAQLASGIEAMNSRGLWHFDLHFDNLLSDHYCGQRIGDVLAAGAVPDTLPGWARRILARHAPVASIMDAFFDRQLRESLMTPYPDEAVAGALAGRPSR